MNLSELSPVPEAALPVAQLKDHLRLGTGFADEAVQDGLLAGYLRAALAAIEGRTGKALIAREFLLELQCWRSEARQPLPVAPVASVASVTMRSREGAGSLVDPGRYRLLRDAHRPQLEGAGLYLPGIPVGGRVEVVFTGGFGVWAEVPADLAQAVMLLAAQFHEHRHEPAPKGLPQSVAQLIERWRQVRVLGGGAA